MIQWLRLSTLPTSLSRLDLDPSSYETEELTHNRSLTTGRTVLTAYTEGLTALGWDGDPRLVELAMCAAAVKFDWLTPAMLATASAGRQVRYGGIEEIDADHKFRERGLALLHNAGRARRALTIAAELEL